MRKLAALAVILLASCGDPVSPGLDVHRPEVVGDAVPACCYCLEGGAWECEVWPDGAEACIDWGAEIGLTVSWDPDCPAAATEDHADDVVCAASCA